MLEGDWSSIIADVQSVRFPLELISNTLKPEDAQAIDNVRLVQLANPCPGEVNSDGSVDLADLNLVLGSFGTSTTTGDANGDGNVDLADLNIVLGNFGTDCN